MKFYSIFILGTLIASLSLTSIAYSEADNEDSESIRPDQPFWTSGACVSDVPMVSRYSSKYREFSILYSVNGSFTDGASQTYKNAMIVSRGVVTDGDGLPLYMANQAHSNLKIYYKVENSRYVWIKLTRLYKDIFDGAIVKESILFNGDKGDLEIKVKSPIDGSETNSKFSVSCRWDR
jgi:hypothetical protein